MLIPFFIPISNLKVGNIEVASSSKVFLLWNIQKALFFLGLSINKNHCKLWEYLKGI